MRRAQQAQMDQYVKSVAGSGGAAGEIEKAKGLLDSGAITQAEYDSIKQKALAGYVGLRGGRYGRDRTS